MKKVLIIGGTSGIGKGLVDLYLKNGHKVGVVGRRTEHLKQIKSTNQNVFIERLDVSNTSKSNDVYNSLISKMNGIDILINCSGWGDINKEFDKEIDLKTIQTNVIGFTQTMNFFTNYFLNKKNGVLVNLSSIGGIRGGKFVGSYNSSKSYQITFLESLSISLSKLNKNIQITDVRLGPVKTKMLKGEGFFWVSSVNDTCEKIYKGINKGKRIIYNDSRWRLISNLLRVIPHSLLRL
jgi:short-subunit dehydrogenase